MEIETHKKQPVRADSEAERKRQIRVRNVSFFQKLLLFPLSILLRIWLKTLRFRVPEEIFSELKKIEKTPIIVAFWHNRLFIAPALRSRFRSKTKMNGLVSPSSDGAILTQFFKFLGIGAVRGSTSRRGGTAIVEIFHKISHGEAIALTPDGPRGPRYKFNPGTALLAQKTGVPVVLVAAIFSAAIRLKTWDSFILPLPFSKVELMAKFNIGNDEMYKNGEITVSELAEILGNELLKITKD